MQTTIFDWDAIATVPTRTGWTKRFFKSPTGTLDQMAVHVTTLNPGENAHAPHRHPEEEIILLKEGTLTALVNDKTFPVTAGSLFFIAPGDLHGVTNTGDAPATYYVIKWFPPGMGPKA